MQTLSIDSAVKTAWSHYKKRPFFLTGLFLLTGLLSFLIQGISEIIGEAPIAQIVLSLIGFVIQTFVSMGIIHIALQMLDQQDTGFRDILAPAGRFFAYLGTIILQGLIFLVGFVLLIIPGIYWGLMFMMAPYAVIDQQKGPIEALKESKHLTDGHKWTLLGLNIVLILLNIAGTLALFVGLLVTVPMSWLAYAYAYRTLQAKQQAGAMNHIQQNAEAPSH